MKKPIVILICTLCIGFSALVTAQNSASTYKVVNTFHVDGDNFWDYLTTDPATGRLFISHGTMVQVLDINKGKVIGTIPNTNGVHGIALAPDLNEGFISDGRDTAITIFNLKTLEVIATVKVTGQNPDAILYDPFTRRVFTFNGRSSNATAIDAYTHEVLATIPLSGKPEAGVTDNNGKIFVNIEDKSEITEINPVTLEVEHTWSIAPGEEPSGLAIDVKNNRLFSVCHNKLMVVFDTQNGKVVTTLPTGEHTDGAAFDPELKRAYSSNGDGTLTVVQEEDANTFKVLENVKTQEGARTVALDPANHHLYLSTAERLPPQEGKRWPGVKPGTFTILDVSPGK